MSKNLLFFLLIIAEATAQTAIPYGHAHNDYAQDRPPLEQALACGMSSIEIDVYPRKGKLKVAHLPFLLASKKDIEQLYFAPLAARKLDYHLVLMIDIKDRPEEAYPLIKALYQEYQAKWTADGETGKPLVELLLSGKKPWEQVRADSGFYARLDAGLGQIGDQTWTAQLAPRVSCRYPFRWKGKGEMPETELAQLRLWVEQAHADNRQLRFWAMPQNEAVWALFRREGVDWLNIDDVQRFKKWVQIKS